MEPIEGTPWYWIGLPEKEGDPYTLQFRVFVQGKVLGATFELKELDEKAPWDKEGS